MDGGRLRRPLFINYQFHIKNNIKLYEKDNNIKINISDQKKKGERESYNDCININGSQREEKKQILSSSFSCIGDESFVNTTCSICLSLFQKDDLLIILPCDKVTEKHSFHKQCIEKWLRHHNTCPLCNKIIEIEN